MTWLLWKEYRLQRLILAVGALVLVMPYGFPVRALLIDSPGAGQTSLASFTSTILSIVILALLGGNAFAGERADRSAEFQAYQPIPRWAIVLSKLPLPLLTALIFWGMNLAIFSQCVETHFQAYPREWMIRFMVLGSCAFAVAWLVSVLQSSVTFAVGAGMAAPIVILPLVALTGWLISADLDQWTGNVWAFACLAVSVLSFTIGTWHYLQRVEP